MARAKINWRAWILGGLFILLLAGAAWLILFSGFFTVKTVKAVGDETSWGSRVEQVIGGYLAGKFFKVVPRNNLILLRTKTLKQKIEEDIPDVSDVYIKKFMNGKIEILAKERNRAAIWCRIVSVDPLKIQATSTLAVSKEALDQSKECFFSDEAGFLFREAPEISGTSLPTFYGTEGDIKAQPLASSSIVFATDFKREAKEGGLEITGFFGGDNSETLVLGITEQGWSVYLDQKRSARNQAKVIEALLENELKGKTQALQYIDLRIANRVYYK